MSDTNAADKILVWCNTVIDKQYEAEHVNEALMEDFVHAIPEAVGNPDMDVPRADDTTLLLQSQLQKASSIALKKEFDDAAHGHEEIFGKPSMLVAGGSLANSAATILNSYFDGKPIVEGKILTNLPENEQDASVFVQSYDDGVVLQDVIQGECLEAHIVPYHGGRSQFPTINDVNPTNTNMSPYLFTHLQKGEYDEFYLEGFVADNPNFENEAKTVLTGIGAANMQREMMGKPPMKLVITAGAQHVCDNPVFRDFVAEAIKMTDVRIHANTGEFRRLLDNDQDWRVDAQKDFGDLKGKDLENAKKGSSEYRAAKTAANVDTIQKVMKEWVANSDFDLTAVVTDGGNTGYHIHNDTYFEWQPKPFDISTIVDKVGAGDAFAGYYTLADKLGFDAQDCMDIGGLGATYTLQQKEARPQMPAHPEGWTGYDGAVSLLAKHGYVDDYADKNDMTASMSGP